ncbi:MULTISPECIES: cupin domain-containing protein [unclassified Mesorhizobium]|uniref:cupin domain-containing protein n=2 Tax=Mesorhizobium TaxID=68287 RepID=UPI000F762D25|nr:MULTISPECIES: cupin domain-containing protein [unclassified Mesorhizobium]AZO03412.1 cupin domain-containing protein [Mesorhizobium sp. M2A.F.Ca.ET.043.02.1.1]RUW39422.1 cupin domain-containing protein [Mesorhizobium sp. M2A.F.Ca.ET.015.02.1.1]RVC90734.1 cupin domain-containing protein [Mesorhizobium sp. M2A.F.Ca.ET.017.03.2.1]RWB43737.1 MAG: cupin domain-containing protein [Mesorhizobium sp.]RWB58331.1 MAG: cupin domain-containing protein [Mesorhizobium sp.]
MTSAAEIIATLGLKPHPEGGWYAETFRDAAGGPRGHSTAIYFLLEQGQLSAWHRVKDAAEVWHFYAGAPLALSMHEEEGAGLVIEQVLGTALATGERPQVVVPAGWWQSARSLGEWTLVGCTVAPGFDFAAFELAEPGWRPV